MLVAIKDPMVYLSLAEAVCWLLLQAASQCSI